MGLELKEVPVNTAVKVAGKII